MSLKICEKTLRPFYSLDKKLEKIELEEEKSKKNSTFDLFKSFESYIMKYKKLPTTDELILYLNDKYVESKKYETLPYLTEKWV
jgi:hypothetical protein